MSLLALLAEQGGGVPQPQPLPYAFPTAAPYNVSHHTITPTDDGTGQSIHPSVLDFGAAGFAGHRFWMTTTAFFNAENQRENPHVYYSDDGYNWAWPPGVTNPLDPWPGAATSNIYWYNNDSNLEFDPDTGTLILLWRDAHQQATKQRIYIRTTTDGSNWTPEQLVLDVPDDSSGGKTVSPSLVRVSSSEWRLYFAASSGTVEWNRYFTAPSYAGPWSSPQVVTYTGPGTNAYHGTVKKLPDGRYLSLFLQGVNEYPGVSIDGINFTTRDRILWNVTVAGNAQNMYKACMAVDKLDPTMVNVWYTTHGEWGRWVCYTRVPLTAFTG